MIFLVLQIWLDGFISANRHSSGLGTSTLSFDTWKFSGEYAIATPPPLLPPTLGVEIYLMPFISNISSMARWCLLLSFFSQTSVKKHKSVSLMLISSARLLILDQIDLMLYSETAGRDRACTRPSSLFITFRAGGL